MLIIHQRDETDTDHLFISIHSNLHLLNIAEYSIYMQRFFFSRIDVHKMRWMQLYLIHKEHILKPTLIDAQIQKLKVETKFRLFQLLAMADLISGINCVVINRVLSMGPGNRLICVLVVMWIGSMTM